MSFLTRESVLVDSANRNHQDVLLMALTGAYGRYSPDDVNHALIRAAINGNAACVALLLDWGADCDAEDMDGDTPLMLAACNNYSAVVKLLLKAGCGVNRVSDRHRTALHMAAWVGNVRICHLLLQAGADPTIREMYGDTALMLASHRSPEVASLLAKESRQVVNLKNESGDSALGCAAKAGHLQCVKDLLTAGAHVNAQNRHGESPLMLAVYENRQQLAKCLLEHGACPNLPTQSGAVPIHFATKKKFVDLTTQLLENGADPNLADKLGHRALSFAVDNGDLDLVIKLVQAGADPCFQGPALFQRRTVVVSPMYKSLLDKRLDLARALHRAGGCLQSQLFDVQQCEDLRSELDDSAKGREVLEFVADITHTPTPLRLKCLQAVLACVGRGPARRQKILTLQLPKPLIAFLLFEDLDK